MISAFANSFKVPDLRSRILFTLAMIVIVRIGASITLPGIDVTVLDEWIKNRTADAGSGAAQVAALLNVFSGGGLQNCAIFALGIMPYISASIMLQLLTAVVPRLSKMAREDGGRQKITQYTRLATIVLCVFQGYLLAQSLQNPGQNIFLGGLQETIERLHRPLVPDYSFWGFVLPSVITITAGTMLMMWLGEMITERGIGNGVSLLICVNIVSDLPGAMVQVWQTYVGNVGSDMSKPATLVLLLAFMIIVIAGVIALTQATRRIVIQYAKRVVGRKVYGGQTQYLPLKINYSGVMPIIFAQAILLFPSSIIASMFPDVGWVQRFSQTIASGWVYYSLSAALIFFFSYFWVATMFQPTQISEDLKRSGGYIPGIRPGKPTADFLDFTMSRLTFAGAIFLTLLYIMPGVVSSILGIAPQTAQFFGGTSLLILVGVVLDVMRQIETHLLQSHYDGFLKKGRIRGRFDRMQQTGNVANPATVVMLWTGIALITLLGVAWLIYNKGM
ncbi:protein translocase subunit secY/sec61 alpha [Prosthecobacter debontii]|uniref:Protein translocase subunit SecY n=1 Tax=Prosthecobacter debontii TaxID=48467 RepID=A0A1T4YXF4_9BACT|nr:preprotein translocase subunit SecY [Prosthecobacter debontii]SKB06238.1 protein translocase subunit secY/sec61 alpha [Prosthecobacter debontii]